MLGLCPLFVSTDVKDALRKLLRVVFGVVREATKAGREAFWKVKASGTNALEKVFIDFLPNVSVFCSSTSCYSAMNL